MRDAATALRRNFLVLGIAGAVQALVALALLAALLMAGQRGLVDIVVILAVVAMLLATAAGALILASHLWLELGQRLAAPRLPGPAEAALKRLAGLPLGLDPQR